MRVCGIELKANNTILTVVDNKEFLNLKIKKITLEDDECQDSIKEYFSKIEEFLKVNCIDKLILKKRAKKGNFAGGAVTFKMEALIQLNSICKVKLISSQSLSSFEKRNEIVFPKELKKYQEQSYLCALND
ncbi:hypothetical protein CP960_04190 [Malaciobacter halophilus]|uniref:DUF3010 domain-containing protein n=1 Tax=Malaciobacter halophilus TaxID=197482 RepID=A0A2N1J4K2_9BACT|nr:DUF3010 family protein [Malaciobacter halophilus]AXH09431.1 DUF3010 domain-containing protein [Malaciobacter halophilus]PKI81481.1 hypothetical protein CP960_04190 [Malaciobacter halophilus]